ncbi:MAG TPA: SDR family oxidoreductase [Polyangiaceae bacterium]|nr:SDR family oxidoreductase [Polyangiaceae bacterium]
MEQVRIALVTGANRGIGRAVAEGLAREGFHVVAASREAARAGATVEAIAAAGGSAEAVALDVRDPRSARRAADFVAERHGRLDALVNNAGVMLGMADDILGASREHVDESFATNTLGPLEVVKALLPSLRASKRARVVNVSSTVGLPADIVDPRSPYAGVETASYRLSKSALNAVTALLAKALRADGILVNAMCPGWTRTDMGGEAAPRSPQQAADTAIWLATLPDGGPTGGFFADRERVAW